MTCVLISLVLDLTWDKLQSLIRSVRFPSTMQCEHDTWYDIPGRFVFTNSKGLVGVGLPRKGTRKDPPAVVTNSNGKQQHRNHGWGDIKDGTAGTVIEQTVTDDTFPNGPHQKIRRYEAPFTLTNREADDRVAWRFFDEGVGA